MKLDYDVLLTCIILTSYIYNISKLLFIYEYINYIYIEVEMILLNLICYIIIYL